MPKLHKKNGFTLIELIVVIAIIAVMVTIIVPSMVTFVSNSSDSANLANARAIFSAAQAVYAKFAANSLNTSLPENGPLLSSDTGDYMTAVKANLGSNDSYEFIVTISDLGVHSVTYEDQTYQP